MSCLFVVEAVPPERSLSILLQRNRL